MKKSTASILTILDFSQIQYFNTYSPRILLTFLVYYLPFFCHSSQFVDDGETERPTVLGPIQVLCGHIHVRHVVTDSLHWVDQCGTVVIDVLHCDSNGASDGFSWITLKMRRNKYEYAAPIADNRHSLNSLSSLVRRRY